MPTLSKKDIKKLIGSGDTENALELLLTALPEANKNYNKFTLLKGRWATAQEQVKRGLENRKTIDVVFNRITDATLSFLEDLDDSDLIDRHDKHNTRVAIQKISNSNSISYKYDIFFSFSNKDMDDAKELCNQLRGYGLRVFFSADDMRLKGGHQFSEVIDEALENSCHFLLHCTPNSMASEWVKIEYTTFHDQIYISDRNNRRFLILEGINFDEKLLRISYRNIQRVNNIHEILNILLPFCLKNNSTSQLEEEKARQDKLAEQKKLEEEKARQDKLAEQKKLEEEKARHDKLAEQKKLEEEKARQDKLAEQKKLEEEKARHAKLAKQKPVIGKLLPAINMQEAKKPEYWVERKRLQEEKMRPYSRYVIYCCISSFFIFALHYGIRISCFSYKTPMGFWITLLILSLVSSIITGTGFGLFFFLAKKQVRSGSIIIIILTGFLLYGFYMPIYTYYAFDKGFLIKEEIKGVNPSKNGLSTDLSVVYLDSVRLNLSKKLSNSPKLIDSYHVIKEMETINTIAKKYQVPIDSIFKWNPELNRKKPLKVGFILSIGKI